MRDGTQGSEDTGRWCDFTVTQKAWNRDVAQPRKAPCQGSATQAQCIPAPERF